MVNLLKIEDSTIKAMLDDTRFIELLPCLNNSKRTLDSIKPGGENCNDCQKKKRQKKNSAMQTAKQCIKNTRGQRLYQLKKMLGAKQLRLTVVGAGGKVVKFTM